MTMHYYPTTMLFMDVTTTYMSMSMTMTPLG